MTFPTPYKVGHHAWSAGPADEHNNVGDLYTPPLDRRGRQVSVIGWESSKTEPPVVGHAERTVTLVDLQVPAGFRPENRDVIDLPSGQFEVVGFEDWNTGFHGWQPGNVVKLRKVDG